jgi:hypothetical protein
MFSVALFHHRFLHLPLRNRHQVAEAVLEGDCDSLLRRMKSVREKRKQDREKPAAGVAMRGVFV